MTASLPLLVETVAACAATTVKAAGKCPMSAMSAAQVSLCKPALLLYKFDQITAIRLYNRLVPAVNVATLTCSVAHQGRSVPPNATAYTASTTKAPSAIPVDTTECRHNVWRQTLKDLVEGSWAVQLLQLSLHGHSGQLVPKA